MAKATIQFTAEIRDLRKKLAENTDITRAEARKMVSELAKANREINKSNKKIESSFKTVGDAAGDTESSLRAISGALGMLSPEAESAFNVVAELGGALEGTTRGAQLLGVSALPVLAVATAGVTVAATAAYGAWILYNAEAERNERISKNQALVLDGVAGASKRVTSALLGAQVATGEVTSEQAAFIRAQEQATEARDKDIDAIIEKSGVTREQVEAVRGLMAAEGDHTRAVQQSNQEAVAAAIAINAVTTAHNKEVAALEESRDAQIGARQAREDAAEASKRAANAAAAQREEEAALATLEAERTANLQEMANAQSQLDAIVFRAQKANATAAERAIMDIDAQIEKVKELEKVSGDSAAGRAAIAELEAKRVKVNNEAQIEAAERVAEDEAAAWEIKKERFNEEKEKAEALHAQRIALAEDQVSLAADVSGAIGDLAEMTAERNEQAAMRLFRIQKGVNIAQAISSGALSVLKTLESVPFPLSIPAGIAAGGVAAVQVAKVASAEPSFADTPAPIRVGSGGGGARFAPGDLFVAGRTEDDIQRQLDSRGGGGRGDTVVVDSLSHWGRFGRDAMRAPEVHMAVKRQSRRTPGKR